MARVTTPAEGFSGVVAGVAFTDGVGETDDSNALNYFRRHGYGIGSQAPSASAKDDAQTGGDDQGEEPAQSAPAKPAKKTAAKRAARN